MTNPYIPDETALAPGELARSEDINSRYEATVSAFDNLPIPAAGKRGFGEPVPIAEAVEDDEATTKAYVDGLLSAQVVEVSTARDEAVSAKSAAQTAAGAASTSESNSLGSKNAAAEWAVNPEDSYVSAASGGDEVSDYSSMHWAKKAEGFAQSVSPSLLVSKTGGTGSALMPVGTTAQRDAIPTLGNWRENSTTGQPERGNGSDWVAIGPEVGDIGMFPYLPAGRLPCEGAVVLRSDYPALWVIAEAHIAAGGVLFTVGDGSTTFGLPDLRSEFLRGWDNGRGVDVARVLGSAQDDRFEEHGHQYVVTGANGATSSSNDSFITGGGQSTVGPWTGTADNIAGRQIGKSTIGSTETRPRNIAVIFAIKY